MQPLGMAARVPFLRTAGSEQEETACLGQFVVGEGLGAHGLDHQVRVRWDVNHFLKKG